MTKPTGGTAEPEPDDRSFPRMPEQTWWRLRDHLMKKVPSTIDSSLLQTVLDISEGTAKNTVGTLRQLKFIDAAGKPTTRMLDWRHDEDYPRVAKELLQEMYPEELLSAIPPPEPDRVKASKWFARKVQTGEAAAGQMAAFYLLLARQKPGPAAALTEAGAAKRRKNGERKPRPATAPLSTGQSTPEQSAAPPERPAEPQNRMPTMHVNIQVHVSPQATAEQIELVFQSMAKHLYGR